MSVRSFSLEQFRSAGLLPDLELTGEIDRCSDTLSLSYALLGPMEEISIAEPSAERARRNSLWEGTCFEFFLGAESSDQYWEFNLSPAGHWNVYRFKAYRQGMQEEQAFTSLPFSVLIRPGVLRLSLALGLDRIIRAEQTLRVGISAVIKTTYGKLTYWALAHPGPQPDFHRRDSFIVEL